MYMVSTEFLNRLVDILCISFFSVLKLSMHVWALIVGWTVRGIMI